MAPAYSGVVAGPGVRATVLSIGEGDFIWMQQCHHRFTLCLDCIDAAEMAQGHDCGIARSYLQTRRRLGSTVTF